MPKEHSQRYSIHLFISHPVHEKPISLWWGFWQINMSGQRAGSRPSISWSLPLLNITQVELPNLQLHLTDLIESTESYRLWESAGQVFYPRNLFMPPKLLLLMTVIFCLCYERVSWQVFWNFVYSIIIMYFETTQICNSPINGEVKVLG